MPPSVQDEQPAVVMDWLLEIDNRLARKREADTLEGDA